MASCKLMRMYHSTKQRRSWRVLSPKFSIKLLTVVVLTFFLILKPTSALLLPQHPSEQTSDQNSNFLHLFRNTFQIQLKWRSHGARVGRRVLLQADGRFSRPSPVGYPPPGDNQHFVPHAPSIPRDGRRVP